MKCEFDHEHGWFVHFEGLLDIVNTGMVKPVWMPVGLFRQRHDSTIWRGVR